MIKSLAKLAAPHEGKCTAKTTMTWGLVAVLASFVFSSVKADSSNDEEDYTILIAALTTLGIIFIAFVYERLPDTGGFFIFKALTSESGVICFISILLGTENTTPQAP